MEIILEYRVFVLRNGKRQHTYVKFDKYNDAKSYALLLEKKSKKNIKADIHQVLIIKEVGKSEG